MEKTRERIFGVVVILSLMVIFGPMLFEATKQHRIQLAKSIPKAPKVAEIEPAPSPKVSQPMPEPFQAQREQFANQDLIDEEIEGQSQVLASNLLKQKEPIKQDLKVLEKAESIAKEQQKLSQTAPKKTQPAIKKEPAPEQIAKTERPDLKSKQQKPKPKPKVEPAVVGVSKPTIDNVATKSVPTQQLAKIDSGWSVQLGTFGNQANAERLLKKLKAAGYPAYIKPKQSGSRTLNLVFVGPKVSRAEAQALIGTLEQKYGLKGIVTKYKPY